MISSRSPSPDIQESHAPTAVPAGTGPQQPGAALEAEPTGSVINPAAFKGGFSEANLLAYLARDLLRERGLQRGTEGSAPAAAKASLSKVHRLLGTLDK